MSSEGTITVLTAVAKQDGIFSAADIVKATALDRQLVAYHLGKFTENGYLIKSDAKYIVPDKSALIDAIAHGAADQSKTKAVATDIYTEHNADILNDSIDLVLQAMAADLPCSRELKSAINDSIKRTVSTLSDARRGLNTRQRGKRKVKKEISIDKEQWLEAYTARLNHFGVEYSQSTLETYVENL